jgi:hypothetical protein
MPLFPSKTAEGVWLEFNCHMCFQVDEAERRLHGKDKQCPIQKRALESGRKPVKWDRNSRTKEMARAYKCREFKSRPDSTRRRIVNEFDTNQDSLFELTAEQLKQGNHLVPVEGWPDRPRKDAKDDNHA